MRSNTAVIFDVDGVLLDLTPAEADAFFWPFAKLQLPRERIAYIGDNLNDVEAELANGVHFIGFSRHETRCGKLKQAGAERICNNHADTLKHIEDALRL